MPARILIHMKRNAGLAGQPLTRRLGNRPQADPYLCPQFSTSALCTVLSHFLVVCSVIPGLFLVDAALS